MKNILAIIGIFAISFAFQSCDDFADLIAESPCINNDDAEVCIQGERVSSLPGTSSSHCCENQVFRDKIIRQCALNAAARSEIAGEFTSALSIKSNTRIIIDIRTVRYGAFHKRRDPHCNNHDDECQDEVIGQEYKIIGKIGVQEDLSAKVDAVTILLKELGLDPGLVAQKLGQVGGRQGTQLVSRGVMASICEERDHDLCPAVDGIDSSMVAVNSRTEQQLDSLIKKFLYPDGTPESEEGDGDWF